MGFHIITMGIYDTGCYVWHALTTFILLYHVARTLTLTLTLTLRRFYSSVSLWRAIAVAVTFTTMPWHS